MPKNVAKLAKKSKSGHPDFGTKKTILERVFEHELTKCPITNVPGEMRNTRV
jgi:hypothetical protein